MQNYCYAQINLSNQFITNLELKKSNQFSDSILLDPNYTNLYFSNNLLVDRKLYTINGRILLVDDTLVGKNITLKGRKITRNLFEISKSLDTSLFKNHLMVDF